jgi:hypothetical protein
MKHAQELGAKQWTFDATMDQQHPVISGRA